MAVCATTTQNTFSQTLSHETETPRGSVICTAQRVPGIPPPVSVLMPVYNGAKFLSYALDSVRRQTMTELELIAVDDGSDDATPAILAAAAAEDPRIRPIRLARRSGIVQALNRGLASARSDLIARLDADDIARPRRLELQTAYLESHPSVVALGSNVMYIDSDGDPIGTSSVPLDHAAIDATHMTGVGGALIHPSSLLRRRVVLDCGGYRRDFSAAEDLDLFLRLAEVGRIANIGDTLVDLRLHTASHSLKSRQLQRRQSLEVMRQAHLRRGVEFDPNQFRFPEMGRDNYGSHEYLARLALAHGHTRTARKHAVRGLLGRPLLPSAWRTLVRAWLTPVEGAPGSSPP